MKNSILFLLILLIIQGCKQNKDDPFNNEKKDTYLNPIIAGDYPDPSVVKVGDDYYMTHSSFEYVPGLLIWHSKDLVNWEPVCNALNEYLGSVFAPDLIYHDSLYYIYFPVAQVENGRFASFSNFVITSKSPEGPWSDPVDLRVGNIDPGHVVDDEGNRFLMLSKGYLVPLNETGDSVTGEMEKVYDGWEFPDEYLVECFCLESPKYTKHNDYYYLTVAEGGTAGPATSHMVVSSRSKTPWGPWEHSPYNPIVKTWSADEKWWSKGHGTLVEGPGHKWYVFYHGYEKGFYNLGRQTLMEPIEWTEDNWFKVPDEVKTDQPIAIPEGEKVSQGLTLSDDFNGERPGLQWRFYKEYDPERFFISNGELTIKGKGSSPVDCGPLLSIPGDHAYQIETKLTLSDDASG